MIERIRAALREGVIGALAVHVAGLKPLLAPGGILLVVAALVVALVDAHVVALVVVVAIAVVDLATSVLIAAVESLPRPRIA